MWCGPQVGRQLFLSFSFLEDSLNRSLRSPSIGIFIWYNSSSWVSQLLRCKDWWRICGGDAAAAVGCPQEIESARVEFNEWRCRWWSSAKPKLFHRMCLLAFLWRVWCGWTDDIHGPRIHKYHPLYVHIQWNKQTLLVENVQFVCRKINKSDHDRDQKISVYSNDPCHYIFVRVDQWGFRIFIQQINQNSDFRF